MNASCVSESPQRRNGLGLLITALISAAAIFLTGCTSTSGTPIGEGVGLETSIPSVAADGSDGSSDSGDSGQAGPVQDIWIWEQVRTVADDGEIIDLTKQMVSGLTWDTEQTVELMDGVLFTPVPELAPRMLHTATQSRADLDIVAGVVEFDGRSAIQIIATPTGAKSVTINDHLVLDLGYLGLDVGAPLIVDYAFAHGRPAAGIDDGVSSTDILAARIADNRFWWYSVVEPEAEGGIDPGLLTSVGSVPDPGAITGEIVPAGFGSTSELKTTVGTAVFDRSATGGAIVASTPIVNSGGTPAKKPPKPLPLPDLKKCRTFMIKCVAEYFKVQVKNSSNANDFLKQNLEPGSDNKQQDTAVCYPKVKGSDCAKSSGEPHLSTFDGVRIDLQQVGEYVAAKTDDFEVQLRTTAWGNSDKIAINTAAAISFGDHRVTIQPTREAMVLLDGEPLDVSAYVEMELGDYGLTFWAGVLIVRGPHDVAAGASGIAAGRGAIDIAVSTGASSHEWQGLFGSADGDKANDLQARDGTVLSQPATQPDFYRDVADTWRISDAESLFDYEPGESTATFTDLNFPRSIVTLDDIDPGLRRMATTVCVEAGVTDPAVLQECVFDYAMTRDISFVQGAQYQTGVAISQPDDGWITGVSGIERISGTAVFAGSDLVLLPSYGRDGTHQIVAMDQATGTERWRFDTGGLSCVAGTETGHVVVPYRFEGNDSDRRLAQLDPADGSVMSEIELSDDFAGHCLSMVTVGDTVIMNSQKMHQGLTDVLGYDAAAAEVIFTTTVVASDNTNLALSDNETVWMGANHQGTAISYQFDVTTGIAAVREFADVKFNQRLVGTGTGFAVPFSNVADSSRGGMLWFDGTGEPRTAALPTADFAYIPTDKLVAGDGYVAGYLRSEDLAVFDSRTAAPHRVINPSSFHNNGGQLAIYDGMAVVGNFGSDLWLEAFDLASGLNVWSLSYKAVANDEANIGDIKYLGPVSDNGLVVVSASMGDGILVGMVGPNSVRE